MASFDFINDDEFRKSLESDYTELALAMQNKAWKSVFILAGSIIEAVLIDYLVFSDYQKKKKKDPLRMSLAEAISACREEDVLSESTEHLSHVIRSYRNLIHPGRAVRLNQKATEIDAKIVQALVDKIIGEVADRRKQNYGYTAEQIITKIETDTSSAAIIRYLLEEAKEYEKERLILKVIPDKYFNLLVNDAKAILPTLVECFRQSFEAVAEETKRKVLKEFIRILKEANSNNEWRYAFFRAKDLSHLSHDEAILINQHFLSILKAPINEIQLRFMEGIGEYLSEKDVSNLVFLFIDSLEAITNLMIIETDESGKETDYQNHKDLLIKTFIILPYEKYDSLFNSFNYALGEKYRENKNKRLEHKNKYIIELYKGINPPYWDNKNYFELIEEVLNDNLADLENHPF